MRSIRCAVAVAAGFLSLVSLSSSAHAELHGAKMIYMAWQTPEACAVSVEVTKSEGGLTDGTESLSLGANYNYSFSAGGFNPKSGLGVGTYVLYGSPAFEKQTGAKVDISIPDAACGDFNRAGGNISFSGSLGRNRDIARLTIPGDFGTERAYDALGRTIDLRSEGIELSGYTGRWRIGYEGATPITPVSEEPDGSCSASPKRTSSSLFALVPMLVLGAIVARRRR